MTTPWVDDLPDAPSIFVKIQEKPIDITPHLRRGSSDDLGAVSVFIGQVRNHDPEAGATPVESIEYSAHPNAEGVLGEKIEELCNETWPDGVGLFGTPFVTVVHRVGTLQVGDVALLVVVGTPHRTPGLDLVPRIVEKVKETLPVWKKQGLEDGTTKWSNLP